MLIFFTLHHYHVSITAIIPPKSGGKAGFSSSTPSKFSASASPLLSTPEQCDVPLSPPRSNNLKIHANREDATLTQSSKENTSTSEKEMVNHIPTGIVQSKRGSNERFRNKGTDLQSLLISLLMEKPQGMNLKVSIRIVLDNARCGDLAHCPRNGSLRSVFISNKANYKTLAKSGTGQPG